MDKLNLVENWLNTVAYSHSGSLQTGLMYATHLQKFLEFAEKSPEQISKQYEKLSERKFKHIYAQLLMGFVSELRKKDYAPATVTAIIHAVRSYFKYNDLPLGFMPSGSTLIQFHNRDVQHKEILQILKTSSPRDKAFYTMMAQSGLRPSTLTALRLKDIEGILEDKTPIPCKITVRQENTKGKFSEYFSFMGSESVQYIKDYLKTRSKDLTPDSFLFSMQGREDAVAPSIFSHLFLKTVRRLRENKILDFTTSKKEISVESKTHKHLRSYISRSELRLYNLRKFFRKFAGQAGTDYCNYWMGHISNLGVDAHYFSQDSELHRRQYEEKAMPYLRLETSTPSETEKTIEELREENKLLRQKIEELSGLKGRVEMMEVQMGEMRAVPKNVIKKVEEAAKKAEELSQKEPEKEA